MTEFTYPKRERNSKRPYRLTHLQVEMLQRLSHGEKLKAMATATRDANCMWHMAWRIRIQMDAENTTHAVAIALREGIIK